MPSPFFLTNQTQIMQHTFRSLSILLFTIVAMTGAFYIGCREHDPFPFDAHDAHNIEGRWVDMVGTLNPDWHYHFDQGLLTQSYEAFGGTLTTLTYPYAIRADSVFIGGDANNLPRVWVLAFECADVVMVTQTNAGFGTRFWLKRE